MLADILSRYWWMTAVRGAAWILFGLAVLTWPGLSLLILTFMFGAFVLIDGVSATATALGGRRENEAWWVLLLLALAVGALSSSRKCWASSSMSAPRARSGGSGNGNTARR